jgi:hypothetical protein
MTLMALAVWRVAFDTTAGDPFIRKRDVILSVTGHAHQEGSHTAESSASKPCLTDTTPALRVHISCKSFHLFY